MNNEEMAKQLFMLVGLMQREPIKKMQRISQGEMAMLGFLTYEKSETNPKELSERFNLSTARVANTLNSLERKEYITRVHDSFDRRKVMVYITEKGKTCPTEILEKLAEINAEGRPIWKPMHMQPIFRMNPFVTKAGNGRAKTNAYIKEETEDIGMDIFTRGLCLPSDNKMTAEQQDRIIEVIRACFE